MLTLFETIEQKQLAAKGAELFTIDVTIVHVDDKQTTTSYELYAKSLEKAENLGEKLRYREQNELKQGETRLEQWGLGYKNVLKNKWALIAPWKDPVYKRSFVNGTRMPALHFKSAAKEMARTMFKKNKAINKKDLTLEDINERIQTSIYGYFSVLVIFVCFLLSVYSVIYISHSVFSGFGLGALFAFVSGGTQLAKVIYNHKLLLKWKAEKKLT
ncbi:MAG: hypothetical protein COB83_09730 [Gammaproteobacteria bacterium]|nr:MAG: hypothetical protein COB83_09730 [Gammaproteobacteria bacterium]